MSRMRRKSPIKLEAPKRYDHDMRFYESMVDGSVTLDDLEEFCRERLAVLGIVWKIRLKNDRKCAAENLRSFVAELRNESIDGYANLFEGRGCDLQTGERIEARRRDHVSHVILRLIFAMDPETCDWFKKTECFLFEWRLAALDYEGIFRFRVNYGMKYSVLSDDEKQRLRGKLLPAMQNPALFDFTIFYKVPVLDVLKIVKTRDAYFEDGTAFIDDSQFRAIILRKYEQHLSTELEKSVGFTFYTGGDDRIDTIASGIRDIYENMKLRTDWESGNINSSQLDQLSETSYPPCMRKLHEALKRNNHLRNGGRVQYTLFLKSIGIKPSAAVSFYQRIFMKKMNFETFRKEYLYQFNHLYGLVGAQKNYENKNCIYIAEESISTADDYHGCFFATEDIEDLGKKLNQWNISWAHKPEIVKYSKAKEYGKACSCYFEALHGSPNFSPIIKPIDFFAQSRKILDASSEDPFDFKDVAMESNNCEDDEVEEFL